MRKSSLGRRSSVSQIPVRLSNAGSSGQKLCSTGRKRSGSLIRQPGFSQTKRRSQSEDRGSISSIGARSTMVRANTSSAINTMTPKTPRQSINDNLPRGSIRPSRGDTLSTDPNRRMSSIGGKNSRKDPRPIGEKSFQQTALVKVQQYFDMNGADVIGVGQSIRPMTTNLFVNMIDHLLKYFDSRHVITKSNYLEELPNIMRKMGYKSKLDRSWLMTVNTPHSWQHVIALLSWLVEGIECMECVDTYSMMFPKNLEEKDNPDPDDVEFDSKMIEHLKMVYKIHKMDQNIEAEVARLEDEYIERLIIEDKCTDEDIEVMETQLQYMEEDARNCEEKYQTILQKKEELQDMYDSLRRDQDGWERYIEESENFAAATESKMNNLDADISNLNMVLEKKKEELQKILEKLKGQSISLEEKEKLTSERHELLRKIQFHENSIRGYEKSAFTADLKLAEGVRKLDTLLVEYNTSVAENCALDPRLKQMHLNMAVFQLDETVLDTVSENLTSLKEDGKKSLQELRLREEEITAALAKIEHDTKETEEKIAKRRAQLETVEYDLKQHQESWAKRSQKLKDEAEHYRQLANEITEEVTQFDLRKLKELRTEIPQMVRDWRLVKKRREEYLRKKLNEFREQEENLKVRRERAENAKERLRKKLAERNK